MGVKGIRSTEWLKRRTLEARGGNKAKEDDWDRSSEEALGIWSERYLEQLGARNYASDTIKGRSEGLRAFLSWCAERDLSRVTQITRPILESYQRWLWKYVKTNGKRLSWGRQSGRITTLKDWFRWLTKQDVLMHNPASELELPRKEKRLPKAALTLTEMARLLAVPNIGDALGVRDRAILELFYSCGLRRSELSRLELVDFNEERRTLHVRQGKGKKDRMLPVGEKAAYWMERYLVEVRPRLSLDTRIQAMFLTGYGGPFNADVLSRMVKEMLEAAKLGGKGSCHLLRHTCATHMLEGGADIRYIQQLLGHENLDTTAIYTEVNIRQLQEVHARCHPSGKLEESRT